MIIRSLAPLRLGLGGGGTDVSPYSDRYGGVAFNATISMYAHCTLEPTDDGSIEFCSADRRETERITSIGVLPLGNGFDLYKGIYNRVVRQFNGGKPLSFRLTTYTDAPAGSGLGSSSSLVVAVITALDEWMHLG